MNEHVQRSVKRAKAATFSLLLTDQNPHILTCIIRPYNQRFRELARDSRDTFMAMNIVMEFVLKLDPFPTASERVVRDVADHLEVNSDFLCKSEVKISARSKDKIIQGWSDQAITSEIAAQITFSENDEMNKAVRNVIWGIFACLRQAPRN